MVKRKCPKCDKELYGEDDMRTWTCSNCGTVLGPELNKVAK